MRNMKQKETYGGILKYKMKQAKEGENIVHLIENDKIILFNDCFDSRIRSLKKGNKIIESNCETREYASANVEQCI